MTNRQKPHLKKAFLERFRLHGNISRACREVKIDRSTVYSWQEDDDEFASGYRIAEIEATERLEEAAYERAINGVTQETPIYFRGQAIDSVVKTEYSDTLLIFLLKARAPEKYRDRVDVTTNGAVQSEAQRIAEKYGKTVDEVVRAAGLAIGSK
jgi:hypothetical protein